MAEEPKKKKGWKPGGERGKLHREIGVSEDEKIPAAKLDAAADSKDPEIKRDAIRAKTMEGWNHGKKRAASLYDHPRSRSSAGK
jgi:hypothetical protein